MEQTKKKREKKSEKEEIKCNNIIKRYKNDYIW